MAQYEMCLKWCSNPRTSDRSRYRMIKNVETPRLMSSTNNLLRHNILKETKSGTNETQHLRARVGLLTDTKLKEKSCKLKTYYKGIDGVGKMEPEPKTQDCDPSTKVTMEGCD